ncbi:transposase [Stenotrophomonas maltophilia]|uniref:transposase n=1 Tax=Stenotrophomonas maltophilia TaxID=40324 RepID=UPI003D2F7218
MRDEAVRLVVVEGQTVRDVCQLMDVGPTALRRWIEQWRRKHDPQAEAPPIDAQARIAELEAQNRRLKEERDLLKNPLPSSFGTAITGTSDRRIGEGRSDPFAVSADGLPP